MMGLCLVIYKKLWRLSYDVYAENGRRYGCKYGLLLTE